MFTLVQEILIRQLTRVKLLFFSAELQATVLITIAGLEKNMITAVGDAMNRGCRPMCGSERTHASRTATLAA